MAFLLALSYRCHHISRSLDSCYSRLLGSAVTTTRLPVNECPHALLERGDPLILSNPKIFRSIPPTFHLTILHSLRQLPVPIRFSSHASQSPSITTSRVQPNHNTIPALLTPSLTQRIQPLPRPTPTRLPRPRPPHPQQHSRPRRSHSSRRRRNRCSSPNHSPLPTLFKENDNHDCA